MRRIFAVLALAVVAVVATGVGAGSQEAAASITDVAWWSSSPTATAPERGIAVSSGPSGSLTVAAVRVLLLADTIDTATLVLTEEGGVQASGAQLQVCPTPNEWSAGPKQPMEKAPKPECERSKAALVRAADGSWRADVRSLLAASPDETDVGLMIVPAGAGAVPLGFEVRFQPPAIEATGTSAGADGDDDFSTPSGSFSDLSSDSGGSFGAGSSTSPSGSFPSSSGSFPSSFADSSPLPSLSSAQTSGTFEAGPTAEDSAAAAATAAPTAAAPSPAAAVRMGAATAPEARGSRVGQGLFFIALSTVVGVGVGVAHSRARPGDSGVVA